MKLTFEVAVSIIEDMGYTKYEAEMICLRLEELGLLNIKKRNV